MEIILHTFGAMAQMSPVYTHSVVSTLLMHDLFNDSKLKER